MKNKSEWVKYRHETLSGGSYNSDKLGLTPRSAKYKVHFRNLITAECASDTDLDAKKRRRNKMLTKFNSTYAYLYKKKEISILSFVIDEENYPTVTKFLNNLDKKLKRLNISRLGYVWVRDVGEKRAVPHFHILVAMTRMSEIEFKKICTKRGSKFEVQFVKTKRGLISYFCRKEIYGKENQKTFGQSETFIEPISKKESKREIKNALIFYRATYLDSIEQELKSLKYKEVFHKDRNRSYGKSKHFKAPD